MVKSITIFIPAHNEENSLGEVIEDIVGYLEERNIDYEILLLDDASSDKTLNIMRNYSEIDLRIRYIHFPKKQGLANLMKKGYNLAAKDWVIMISGDGQFKASHLSFYLNNSYKADIIIGNRYQRYIIYSFFRKFISRVSNYLICKLFCIELNDMGWSKLVKRDILNNIKLKALGALVDVELVIKSYLRGFKIYEIKVPFSSRKYGRSKALNLKTLFFSLVSIVFMYFEVVILKNYLTNIKKLL